MSSTYYFICFSLFFIVNIADGKPPVCNITSFEHGGLNFVEHKQTMRIQLGRQKTPMEQQLNSPLRKSGIMDWFEKPKPPTPPRTNDTIRLYKFLDHEFYAKVVVGHPGQTLNVAIDTTWIYTWLMSSRCSGLEEIGCYLHNLYNHDRSSQYKPNGQKFSVIADGYNMSGFYSYDSIAITHSNVTNFNFIEMTKVPRTFLFNKADGILGFGLNAGFNYDPFFYALLKQKRIINPMFAIYINRNHQSDAGGEITLGFADGRHIKVDVIDGIPVCDNIVYLPVDPSLPYWQFTMDSIILAKDAKTNSTYCQNKLPDGSTGCKAIIDTSSSTIVGPAKEVDDIHDKIGATKLILGRYSVSCDRINDLPRLYFTIGGKTFTLKGSNYINKVTYKSLSLCLSAFRAAETEEEEERWILGGAFLQEVYTIYNVYKPEIGFVRAA